MVCEEKDVFDVLELITRAARAQRADNFEVAEKKR